MTNSNTPITLHWFRQDLRLSDNPALLDACQAGQMIPVFILDDESQKEWRQGAASKWWLHRSLRSLNKSLKGNLVFRTGNAEKNLTELARQSGAVRITWNRSYEPAAIKRDTQIKKTLKADGIEVQTFNGRLLWEPWTVQKPDGTPYRVFTKFYRNGCQKAPAPRFPVKAPGKISFAAHDLEMPDLESLKLQPLHNWTLQQTPEWQPGEDGAWAQIDRFIEQGLDTYKKGRDFPALHATSRLSPHLHFGEISPNQVWHRVQALVSADGLDQNMDQFLMELAWREFSYSLLYYNPQLPDKNYQSKFDNFPWRSDPKALQAWQVGKTGIPIVDAGLRELWQTGYMHNRIRMVVASFLTKNLLLHWRDGEAWFWDTLVDADLANNSASWQWVAGCGADAAPYFRIFNPVTQGQRFDPDGEYVRHWVPELAKLETKYLFSPWTANEEILTAAKVTLGETYPHPLVDLKSSRAAALDAYQAVKSTT